MSLSWVLFGIGHAITYPYFPKYIKMLGGSDFEIGLIYAIQSLFLLLFTIPGGHLTDLLGRKRLIVFFTWLVVVIQFFYAAAPYWTYLALIVAVESTILMYRPALDAIIADSLPDELRAKGFIITYTLPNIPWFFMPLIGGWLVDSFGVLGLRYGFLISGLVGIAAASLRAKFLQETFQAAEGRATIEKFAEGFIDSYKLFIKSFKLLPSTVKKFVIGEFLIMAPSKVAYYSFGVIFASEILGLSASIWGIATSLSVAISVIAAPFLFKLVEQASVRRWISIGFLLIALAYLSFMFLGLPGLMIAAALTGLSSTLAHSLPPALITSATPVELRGRANSHLLISLNTGTTWSAFLMGILYSWSPLLAFGFSAIMGFLAALYVQLIVKGEGRVSSQCLIK